MPLLLGGVASGRAAIGGALGCGLDLGLARDLDPDLDLGLALDLDPGLDLGLDSGLDLDLDSDVRDLGLDLGLSLDPGEVARGLDGECVRPERTADDSVTPHITWDPANEYEGIARAPGCPLGLTQVCVVASSDGSTRNGYLIFAIDGHPFLSVFQDFSTVDAAIGSLKTSVMRSSVV